MLSDITGRTFPRAETGSVRTPGSPDSGARTHWGCSRSPEALSIHSSERPSRRGTPGCDTERRHGYFFLRRRFFDFFLERLPQLIFFFETLQRVNLRKGLGRRAVRLNRRVATLPSRSGAIGRTVTLPDR